MLYYNNASHVTVSYILHAEPKSRLSIRTLLNPLSILIHPPPFSMKLFLFFPLYFFQFPLFPAHVYRLEPFLSSAVLFFLSRVAYHTHVHRPALDSTYKRSGKCSVGSTCCEIYVGQRSARFCQVCNEQRNVGDRPRISSAHLFRTFLWYNSCLAVV